MAWYCNPCKEEHESGQTCLMAREKKQREQTEMALTAQLIPVWQAPMIEIRRRVAIRERMSRQDEYDRRFMHDKEW